MWEFLIEIKNSYFTPTFLERKLVQNSQILLEQNKRNKFCVPISNLAYIK